MPCASVTEAVDDICNVIDSAWSSGVVTGLASTATFQQLIFDDNSGSRPVSVDTNDEMQGWGRAMVRHAGGRQASIADVNGVRRWERTGVATIETWSPAAHGRDVADEMIEVMMEALEGASTPSGVWFRNARFNEVGQDGGWYRVNILVDFTYDLIR